MIDYALRHGDKLLAALSRHLFITGVTLALSVLLAALVTAPLIRRPRIARAVISALGAVYSIPSLALFAILIPILGIGVKITVVTLTLYNQFLLTRNFLAGFDGVDARVVEAADGLGMTPLQVFWRVRLPLASPVLLAGVRLAVISTIGIATIAAVVNAGGLGDIIFDGMRTRNTVKLLWGSVLSAFLAITSNAALAGIQRFVEKKFRLNS